MATGIDHIVIAVRDLVKASADFATAGFVVTPGGDHANGATHNALVAFQDGSYFEIIAWKTVDAPQESDWLRRLKIGEGFVDYALRTVDLEVEMRRLRNAGLQVPDLVPGGRVRPDGQRVEWQTLRVESSTHPAVPFWCHSTNDRMLRVPGGDQAIHPNGATGIEALMVGVSNLARVAADYTKIAGIAGPAVTHASEGIATQTFRVGTVLIKLVQPLDRSSELAKIIGTRGDGLVAVDLNGGKEGQGVLDTSLTHGARITIVPLASEHLITS